MAERKGESIYKKTKLVPLDTSRKGERAEQEAGDDLDLACFDVAEALGRRAQRRGKGAGPHEIAGLAVVAFGDGFIVGAQDSVKGLKTVLRGSQRLLGIVKKS